MRCKHCKQPIFWLDAPHTNVPRWTHGTSMSDWTLTNCKENPRNIATPDEAWEVQQIMKQYEV